MDRLLHTPEGVRDIYNVECGKMQALKSRIEKVFHLYGYHDIQTPTFEYIDVFGEDIGTIPSGELYKFFNKDGDTLALRPDITPSVARAAATLFSEEDLPVRLCYTGNTFINHSSYQGRLREVTQMGVELIGDDSVEADAEMLALVIEALQTVGVKEFQLSVGNVDYFQSLIQDASLSDEEEQQIIGLINNRNYFGLEEYLDSIQVKTSSRNAFCALKDLVGGTDILDKAKNLAPNSNGVLAVKRMEKIYQLLKLYGKEEYISFDFSMTGNYGYYTGIIFRGYTYGTGDAIVKGGRYDHLLEKFGKEAPSIGFAIVLDELMQAMNRQKLRIVYPRKNILILYENDCMKEAVLLAGELRSQSRNVELMKRDPGKNLEDYLKYGDEYYAESLLYIPVDGDLTLYSLTGGEQKTVRRESAIRDL